MTNLHIPRWSPGDIVRLKISASQCDRSERWADFAEPGKERPQKHSEIRGTVLASLVETCSGGRQIMYEIRWVSANGMYLTSTSRHHELELVDSEPFPSNEGGK